MSDESCSITESMLRGYRAVRLTQKDLTVTVLPEKGGEIHSLIYRPRGLDILWKAPWGLHKPGPAKSALGGSEAAWMDSYGGGWQVIFPNGGDACVQAGASLGFHGESSTSDWDYACSINERRVSIRMQVRLARSPFHLTREVSIEAKSLTVEVSETIVNEGEQAVSAMWGHHPAFATELVRGATIESSARIYEPHVPEISKSSRIAAGSKHKWPFATGKDGREIDLSHLPLGDERLSEMGYLSDFQVGRYRLENETMNLGIELRWDHKLFPYLWYWLEWGGSFDYPFYGRCRVVAFEPFSSIPGSGLSSAIERGTSILFAAGESRSSEVSLTVLTNTTR